MNKNKWFTGLLILIIVIIALGAVFFKSLSSKTYIPKISNTLPSTSPTVYVATPQSPIPTQAETLTPTQQLTTQPANDTSSTVPGGPRGQVACTLVIPPDNSNYGQAKFDYNWNNLIVGKNGTAKVDLCVNSGGNPSVMSENSSVNGSATAGAGWIILNGYYTVTLYDEHGGDLPDCAGASLNSCVIDTLVPSPANHPSH